MLWVEILCAATALLSAATPTAAAPWDGIVGFLQTVATISGAGTESLPTPREDVEEKPLRKIVYAVEEQVLVGDDSPAEPPSRIVFDSEGAADQSQWALRPKRAASAGEGRDTSVAVARPIFLGRKLWYVPLWFGVYLILYLTVLVVKSVARHRIRYPTLVSADLKPAKRRGDYTRINGLTREVDGAVAAASRRFRNWR